MWFLAQVSKSTVAALQIILKNKVLLSFTSVPTVREYSSPFLMTQNCTFRVLSLFSRYVNCSWHLRSSFREKKSVSSCTNLTGISENFTPTKYRLMPLLSIWNVKCISFWRIFEIEIILIESKSLLSDKSIENFHSISKSISLNRVGASTLSHLNSTFISHYCFLTLSWKMIDIFLFLVLSVNRKCIIPEIRKYSCINVDWNLLAFSSPPIVSRKYVIFELWIDMKGIIVIYVCKM